LAEDAVDACDVGFASFDERFDLCQRGIFKARVVWIDAQGAHGLFGGGLDGFDGLGKRLDTVFGESARVLDAFFYFFSGLVGLFDDLIDLGVEFFLEGYESAIDQADGLSGLVLGLVDALFDRAHAHIKVGVEDCEAFGFFLGLLHRNPGAVFGGLGADIGVADHAIELGLGVVEGLVHQLLDLTGHGVCVGQDLADFVECFVGAVDAFIDHAHHAHACLESFVEGGCGISGASDHFFGIGGEVFEGSALGGCLGDDGFEHLGVSRKGSGVHDPWGEEHVIGRWEDGGGIGCSGFDEGLGFFACGGGCRGGCGGHGGGAGDC